MTTAKTCTTGQVLDDLLSAARAYWRTLRAIKRPPPATTGPVGRLDVPPLLTQDKENHLFVNPASTPKKP